VGRVARTVRDRGRRRGRARRGGTPRRPVAGQPPDGVLGSVRAPHSVHCGPAERIHLQWVQVDPTAVRGNELHPVWPPIDLDLIAEVGQHGQSGRFVRGVQVDVEVAMYAGRCPEQRVDPPPALEPPPAAGSVERIEDHRHLRPRHLAAATRAVVAGVGLRREVVGVGAAIDGARISIGGRRDGIYEGEELAVGLVDLAVGGGQGDRGGSPYEDLMQAGVHLGQRRRGSAATLQLGVGLALGLRGRVGAAAGESGCGLFEVLHQRDFDEPGRLLGGEGFEVLE